MRRGGDLQSHLRLFRERSGLKQEELAGRVGLSRQALSSLEAGRAVPSTAVALRLAHALGCRVEDLFRLDVAPAVVTAELVAPAEDDPGAGGRVALAAFGDRWVAHALPGELPDGAALAADGIALGGRSGRVRVEPLQEPAAMRAHLFVAGCAPALGVLGGRLAEARGDVRMRWLPASSGRALELLGRGVVHVAGAHLRDDETGEYNLPFVRRLRHRTSLRVVTLATWEQGIVARRGGRAPIRTAADLFRPGVRVARREAGAGARALLQGLGRARGRKALPPGPTAASHAQVARMVAEGAADAGIAVASVARSHGLAFFPLAQERFDLIFDAALATDVRVSRLLDELAGRPFRRELEALGGYETSASGALVAEVTPP